MSQAQPRAQSRSPATDGLSCDSHYVRTYLVRAGLLARGMLLRGRIIAFNKMVAEVKKGKPIEDIHPAMPSSEVQFWVMADTSRHLETWFSIIFFELLSGLPVKCVEAVTYVVDPRSVLPAYHKYVQHDPTHRVYRITLATKHVWILDPGGARLGYDEMLLPWKAFKLWKSQDAKDVVTVKPDLVKFELLMGICHHGPTPGKEDGNKGENFVEEESFERRALRMWASCWTDLLPEVFGGSMANIGTLSHADFSMAMDEFLAVFGAYVKTYLLETAYYSSLLRDHSNCLPWANKMYNAHPEGGYDDDDSDSCEECCAACDCNCHETFNRVLRAAERASEDRWELRSRIVDATERKAEELSKEELVETVQKILVDRAGVQV